jgi:RNA polymerase sigma factor for flagellar operon FliA
MRPQTRKANPRVVASLPFVEQLARRVAATMPHSIDVGDLVQDGVIGLIDAAERFDEKRGIKFETFAERRVRGAMIDALRKDAWPRGVRRQRRELEAAREALRRELDCEPSLADLAARVGSDEKKLGRTIVRINTIEATSPLNSGENMDDATMPAVLVPSEPERPDSAYEREETRERVRAAIATLPSREQTVIGRYYFNEATMKEIGAEIGVNESRVSQLHARAIRKLRVALAAAMTPARAQAAILAFAPRPQMVKASLNNRQWTESGGRSNNGVTAPGVVVRYADAVAKAPARTAAARAAATRSSTGAKVAPRGRAALALAR